MTPRMLNALTKGMKHFLQKTRLILQQYFNLSNIQKINTQHSMIHKTENKMVKFVSLQINNIQLEYLFVFEICIFIRDDGA